jgi:hypothetical protein
MSSSSQTAYTGESLQSYSSASSLWPRGEPKFHFSGWASLNSCCPCFEGFCYTRSTPSYKLLSEYNLLLTQRLTSYPLVLGVLYCGSSSFARVTNELPLGVLWLLCVAGTSFARSTAQLSCPPLSLPTQLSESKAAAYIDNPAK